MMYYECHITIEDPPIPDWVHELKLDIENSGWRFSRIAWDPVLGKKTYCYATKHFAAKRELDSIKEEMAALASKLHDREWEPIRQKIESVVFDTTNHTHEERDDSKG